MKIILVLNVEFEARAAILEFNKCKGSKKKVRKKSKRKIKKILKENYLRLLESIGGNRKNYKIFIKLIN
jgi:hypothetical protein